MVGLLAIASLATRGDGRATAPPGSGIAAVAGQHLAVVGALVLAPIVLVGGGALFIYARIFRRGADPEMQRRLRQSRQRTAAVLACAAALLLYRLFTGRNPLAALHLQGLVQLRNLFDHAGGAGHAKLPAGPPRHAVNGGISNTDWTLAVLLWVALAVTVAFVLWRWRHAHNERELRRPVAAAEEPAGPDLDSLRAELNPRRAVIAAYAAMERLMARDGLARGVHEAPMEYLGRVTLHGHDRVAAVHRLTGLFQRARFSRRPVDEDMRRRAIAAVEELADDAGEPA
jgi:hypothetical protein